jgi:hypothetical protein
MEQSSSVQLAFQAAVNEEQWDHGSGPKPNPANTTMHRMFVKRVKAANSIRTFKDLGGSEPRFSRVVNWMPLRYLGFDLVGL